MADQAALHGLAAKVRNPGLELLECAAPTPSWQLRWSNAMQQEPIPRRKAATPRRRLPSPIDRRSPSGRLLPY